ncbi:MAG: hypothetical protein WAP51_02945 [Candidatus Sungiibacteriota bacterium]
MSEKIKHNLKVAGGWVAFIVAMGLLMASPAFYLRVYSGSLNGRQAVCAAGGADAKTVPLQEVILRSDYWNFQKVAVSGKLSYSENRETFYLRDGIFSIPLNVSDCQNLHDFEQDEMLIAAKGAVSEDNGELLLTVTELREEVPGFFKVMFNAGFLGLISILAVPLILGFIQLLLRFLALTGLKKTRGVLSPEETGNRAAGRMLLVSIGAPLTWFINPVFGAGFHIFNVLRNRSGLRSPKSKVAIAGVTLSVAGFVFMFMFSFGAGAFEDMSKSFNFYAITEGKKPIMPTGKESLELKPYINNDLYFSIHQPKSWVADEKKIKTDGLLTFEGPEDGTFQGKPFRPKLNVSFIPAAAIGAQNNADALQKFRALMLKSAGSSIIADESIALAGGRLDAFLVETVEAHKDGYKQHVLGLVAAENGVLYITGSAIPEEKWNDRYAQVTRESFRTLDVWRATFAACLKGKSTVFYGAFDCEHCETQKELFTDGIERLPYVECQQGIDDLALSDACQGRNITGYPTWEFADGSRLIGVQTLKALSEKTECKIF